ncbi:MAG TPA: hypothetical protein VK929_14640 [Longimicrobiales bacterium]|nr:hypothetical protein [Longimicrobiales bacterium]
MTDVAGRRRFLYEGQEWLAWSAGAGAYGTGAYGLAPVEAVHFARATQPAAPVREALLARGRFQCLHDSELIGLLESATPIVEPDGRQS